MVATATQETTTTSDKAPSMGTEGALTAVVTVYVQCARVFGD